MSQADSVPTTPAPGGGNVPAAAETRSPRKSTGKSLPAKPEPAKAAVDAFLAMIERAAKDGAVDTVERLLAWREKELAKAAGLAFSAALAAAQEEMPLVCADAENGLANNSRYASLAAMDKAVRKIYTAHGFGLTFDTEDIEKPETVRLICDVSHRDGHTRRYHLDMPADGKGPKGGDVMNRTHATGSAITYGRRYLLGMIFNLAVSKDDDGNAAGRRPQQQQAAPQVHRTTPDFEDLKRSAERPKMEAEPPKRRLEADYHPHPQNIQERQRRGPACSRCGGTGVFRKGNFQGQCFTCKGTGMQGGGADDR